MNGIINIYKEKDFTSHDVVAKLRGILKMRKIGHTGTLDPMAEGVLPVCLGNATRLCDMLTDHSKQYEAEFILGMRSDTLDITGVIEKAEADIPGEEEIVKAIESFVGGYDQIPPMYSAKKVNGKKLYELARNGVEIERKPVFVQIDAIEVKHIEENKITIVVDCGKGTYIRSLCSDIGEKLGCGAVMSRLVRTRVGAFGIDTAVKLSEVEDFVKEGLIDNYVLGTETVFKELEVLRFKNTSDSETDMAVANRDIDIDKMLHNGNFFSSRLCENKACDKEQFRVYDAKGAFIGIYQYYADRKLFKPFKMFYLGENNADH